ncbi:MAG: cyclic nucleotide-binding domain-containing protein [Archangium sp.]|nr:cyclic nucleotide-binding domain-containing protein [Archangium sp.]
MSDVNDAELAKFSKIFAALDEAGRKKLVSLSVKKAFAKDAVICREGDPGTEFFVLTKGTVSVSADDFGNAKALATLGTGQFFGEIALLAGQPRQATVIALEPVEVVGFPRDAVVEVFRAAPQALTLLQQTSLVRTEETMKKMME